MKFHEITFQACGRRADLDDIHKLSDDNHNQIILYMLIIYNGGKIQGNFNHEYKRQSIKRMCPMEGYQFKGKKYNADTISGMKDKDVFIHEIYSVVIDTIKRNKKNEDPKYLHKDYMIDVAKRKITIPKGFDSGFDSSSNRIVIFKKKNPDLVYFRNGKTYLRAFIGTEFCNFGESCSNIICGYKHDKLPYYCTKHECKTKYCISSHFLHVYVTSNEI